jgi:hypothetical protein
MAIDPRPLLLAALLVTPPASADTMRCGSGLISDGDSIDDVPVDVWTYDLGPNRLVRRVRMIAGRVESIETLERGTSR